jgi:hypothetical protein
LILLGRERSGRATTVLGLLVGEERELAAASNAAWVSDFGGEGVVEGGGVDLLGSPVGAAKLIAGAGEQAPQVASQNFPLTIQGEVHFP